MDTWKSTFMVQRSAVVVALFAVAFQWPSARAAGEPDQQQTQALHALFDAEWEASMRRYPEWATYVGDHRYGDRLYDASPATRAAEFESARQSLARAEAIRRDALSPVARFRSSASCTTSATACASNPSSPIAA